MTAGHVLAGRLVRLACARHLRDREEGSARGLLWSSAHAGHALAFYPKFLRLAEGEHAGQPFVLQPWQQFIIGSLFGWLGADGHRRFRRAYIEASKGQGKTPMLAGLGLYGIAFDDEPGAWIFVAAVTRDQARIMFEDARKMVLASPDLAGMLDVNVNNIAHLESGSFIRPVSSEGRTLDAKRVQMALIDEVHEHETPDVCNKLSAGTKGRRQPLVVEITNAGFDRESICWHHHDYSTRVLEGLAVDDEWFAYVCQLDVCETCRADGKDQPQDECPACDDWRDEAVWPKVAPNLDVSITKKYFRAQVREAIGMPAQQNIVKRLNFCIWTSSFSRWIPPDRWLACSNTVDEADLVGALCYAGLDLGQSDDFCAFPIIWKLEDGRVLVRTRYWLPESALTRYPTRPYDQWRREGRLDVTDGDITDYDLVQKTVGDLALAAGVREIAYDQRFAQSMAVHLEGRGLTMVNTPQGYQLNEALRALSDLVMTGKLCHEGDPILSWMAANMVLRHGTDQKIRPDKEKAREKIDGIVALAMAIGRLIAEPPDPGSIYDTRGILTL